MSRDAEEKCVQSILFTTEISKTTFRFSELGLIFFAVLKTINSA